MDNNDRLMSTVDTAQMLGVSVQFLEYHRKKQDGIPFVKIGPGCTRYKLSDVETFIARNTFQTTDDAARAGHKLQGPKRRDR